MERALLEETDGTKNLLRGATAPCSPLILQMQLCQLPRMREFAIDQQAFPKNKMSTYICKCFILWKFILCVYITSFKGMNEYYKF